MLISSIVVEAKSKAKMILSLHRSRELKNIVTALKLAFTSYIHHTKPPSLLHRNLLMN